MICLSCLAGVKRAANVGAVLATINTSQSKDSANNTTKTLSSNKASGESIAVDIPGPHAVLPPDSGNDGTEKRGVSEHGGGNDPSKCDGTPVGKPLAPLLVRTNEPEVTDDNLGDGDNAHDDGEKTGREGDADIRVSDGLSDGRPG